MKPLPVSSSHSEYSLSLKNGKPEEAYLKYRGSFTSKSTLSVVGFYGRLNRLFVSEILPEFTDIRRVKERTVIREGKISLSLILKQLKSKIATLFMDHPSEKFISLRMPVPSAKL
jgi:hypothetical protein